MWKLSLSLIKPEKSAFMLIVLFFEHFVSDKVNESFGVVIRGHCWYALAIEGSFEIVLHDFFRTMDKNKNLLVFGENINNPEDILLVILLLTVDNGLSHVQILAGPKGSIPYLTVVVFYYAYQQRIIDDLVLSEKLSVFLNDFQKFFPLIGLYFQWTSFEEIKILLGRIGIGVSGLSAVPGSFQIISFDDFFVGVEDIGHDNKINSAYNFALIIFLQKFM